MPCLRRDTTDGPLLSMRYYGETTGMRLTARCVNLLSLLLSARWLSTDQIHRRFFPDATTDATRKRLRKLARAGYVVRVQRDRMKQALFRLGPEGKRILEARSHQSVQLERRPPEQVEHFTCVNDVRIAVELAGGVSYFFAYWELPRLGWRHAIIPDALFAFGERTYALEFDRGVEGVRFFVSTKMNEYRRGFEGTPLSAVIVVADRRPRMEALAKAINDPTGRVLFSTIDLVRAQGLASPVFYRSVGESAVALV